MTLSPDAAVPGDVPGVVCDSFARLRLPGREAEPTGHWMIRDGGERGATTPVPGLTIHRVVSDADIAWFEQLIFLAADGRPPSRPGEMHPPGSQSFPGASWLYAELDGVGVGTAASIATSRVNSIGAVAVLPAFRGRGIASALTEAAIARAPGVPRPASRRPRPDAASAPGCGFTEVGRPLHHHPI